MRAELPSAVCTPESRRTPGTSPRIFQQQSAERQQPCWNFLQLLPRPPHPLILGGIGGTRLGVELVDDEVTEGGFEEVLLGTVFQQGVVHRGGSHLVAAKQKIHQRCTLRAPVGALSSYLLVDLDGLLVLLQLCAVGPDLQQTLVGRTEGEKIKHVQ